MLEKLDNKTAAAIIINMKSKNAGTVLGYIKPDKSVAITREITKEIKDRGATAYR
jgi:flagellar motility protein MotE (MotC chaperone)